MEEVAGEVDPAGAASLRDRAADKPRLPRLVQIANLSGFELADTTPP